jgi:hypothetical protein
MIFQGGRGSIYSHTESAIESGTKHHKTNQAVGLILILLYLYFKQIHVLVHFKQSFQKQHFKQIFNPHCNSFKEEIFVDQSYN